MPLWSNNVDPYDRFKNQLESDKEKAVSCCHCQWSRCNMFVSKFTSPSIPILFRAIWSKQFIPQCLGSHVPGKHKKFGHTKSQLMENKCTDSKKKQAMHIKETDAVYLHCSSQHESSSCTSGHTRSTGAVESVVLYIDFSQHLYKAAVHKVTRESQKLWCVTAELAAQIQITRYIFHLIVNLQSQQLETIQLQTQPKPSLPT